MELKNILLIAVLSFSILAAACGGSQNAPNTNGSAQTSNVSNSTANKTEAIEGNAAPTLTPVYKAYCEAMEKKDDAGLRKVLASETIKVHERDMKEMKVKTIAELLKDENVTTKLCEVRNEKINGDEAVATIISDPYPKGIEVIFVKENGEWKLTTRSPVLNMKTETEPSGSSNSSQAADKK